VRYLLLNQLLTTAKKIHDLLNEETTYIIHYIIIIVMIRPKAILGTRFPYPYCCKTANMSCKLIAACSSEHARPLVVVVADTLATHAILTVLWLSSRNEEKCDKTSQSRLLWKMNVPRGVQMHVYFKRAPGYESICRVN